MDAGDFLELKHLEEVHVVIRCVALVQGKSKNTMTRPLLVPVHDKYQNLIFGIHDLKSAGMYKTPRATKKKKSHG